MNKEFLTCFCVARELLSEKYLCEIAVTNGWGATTALTGNHCLLQGLKFIPRSLR